MLILIFIFRNDYILFAQKNPYNDKQVMKIKVEEILWSTPVLMLQDTLGEVQCQKNLGPQYDVRDEIYQDILSIEWVSKDILRLKVQKDWRLFKKYHSEYLYVDNNCSLLKL